jgi:F-type H+-transporting ATPase subunit b
VEEHKKVLAAAEEEGRDIVAKAREAAEKVSEGIVADARQEAQQAAELARRSIETEKRAALSELRREVADLAVQAAGVILDAELNDDRNRKLVDDLIASIPDAPAGN